MNAMRVLIRWAFLAAIGFSAIWACGFEDSLREYLSTRFWLPFVKRPWHLEKKNPQQLDAPFAGMKKTSGNTPLAKLRAAYQEASYSEAYGVADVDSEKLQKALAAARAASSLSSQEQEEVNLLDAKIDLRTASLDSAKKKLNQFLQTAKTPEYLSEARGWLARIYYLQEQQASAGKIYLDELNRKDSNLSHKTLIDSLSLTYGYDGGQQLLDHLEEYFDTPEHAAFAIQLATNPQWQQKDYRTTYDPELVVSTPLPYQQIKDLLEQHKSLFRTANGASLLATLGMRTALCAGDSLSALRIAKSVPANASVRHEPDFYWMLASAHFLSRDYGGAEQPLLRLFHSSRAFESDRTAAAYGLCGVYQKTGNTVEQIHWALWLHTQVFSKHIYPSTGSDIADRTVYWAMSGWDLGMLLDVEASVEQLQSFLRKYPNLPDIRLVNYSLAVRLSRENRYEEAAQIYEALNSQKRAARMRQLASLYQKATDSGLSQEDRNNARYEMATFLSNNSERIYFNDRLWDRYQRYALFASQDSRLTLQERQRFIQDERKLKDEQDERWRAYLLLREVVQQSGKTALGRRAARLAIQCLDGITVDRFGRQSDIQAASAELVRQLRRF